MKKLCFTKSRSKNCKTRKHTYSKNTFITLSLYRRICSFAGYSSHLIRKFIWKPWLVFEMIQHIWPSMSGWDASLRTPPPPSTVCSRQYWRHSAKILGGRYKISETNNLIVGPVGATITVKNLIAGILPFNTPTCIPLSDTNRYRRSRSMMRAVSTDQLRPWGQQNSKLWPHLACVCSYKRLLPQNRGSRWLWERAEHLLLQLATLALVSSYKQFPPTPCFVHQVDTKPFVVHKCRALCSTEQRLRPHGCCYSLGLYLRTQGANPATV